MSRRAILLAIGLLAMAGQETRAHPVPERNYLRTLVIRLTPTAVVVDYLLEVDSLTVFRDVPGLVDREELDNLTTPTRVCQAYVRRMGPRLARNLEARLDGQAVNFSCASSKVAILDHVRCEFVLTAALEPRPYLRRQIQVRDNNFEEELGRITLAFAADDEVHLLRQTVAPDALRYASREDIRPGDEDRLRRGSATFRFWPAAIKEITLPLPGRPATQTPESPPAAPTPAPATEPASPSEPKPRTLQDLLFNSRLGLWVLLGLAFAFGAAHALTPGHGKTLVAAYLVGERGTPWHAVLLGLVTTLTHTGIVLIVAAVLPWLFPGAPPRTVQGLLELGSGLLIAGLGFWLFQRRLAGRADHVHLFGGHHHHDHDHDHDHDHPAEDQPVGLGSLIVLGISGGIVPCGEAVALFSLAVRWQRLEMAFPLLLAFSAGLASVLVVIGLGVVWTRKFSARWGESAGARRLARLLPIVSAAVVTVLGLWLIHHSLSTLQAR